MQKITPAHRPAPVANLFLESMKNTFKKWLESVHLSPKEKTPSRMKEPGFQPSRFAHDLAGAGSEPSSNSLDNPPTIEDTSDNGLRRQLVQVMLRDISRSHGIPMQSVECQMLVVASYSRGPGLFVRLILRQWDERILRYSVAFQNALRAEILRFDPKAETWLYGISWQFEENGCPYTHMPEKSFWGVAPAISATATVSDTAAAITLVKAGIAVKLPAAKLQHIGPTVTQPAALSEAPSPVANTAAVDAALNNAAAIKDLEQLFFIRDQEMVRSSQATVRHYEKTQPSPL